MDYTISAIWVFMVTAFSITAEAQTVSFPADTYNKNSVEEKLDESFSGADPSGDSLQIHMEGTSNTIMIDSTSITGPDSSVTINGVVVGEINQDGEGNKIKLNTSNKNHTGQKVKIIQTGKNNRATIRSGAAHVDP